LPTHGSLTKAGKVRNQTPKIQSMNKKKPTPSARNFNNYKKRFTRQGEARREESDRWRRR